jgi:hypothetical protein
MPRQLLNRLKRFLDQDIAVRVMALEGVVRADDHVPPPPPPDAPDPPDPPIVRNTVAHWPAGDNGQFGSQINNLQSIVIHETSGWPSYASANNMEGIHNCLHLEYKWKTPAAPGVPHWEDNRGVGSQYFIEPNGTIFTLIGEHDFAGDPRVTWHARPMNYYSIGIENADTGDSGVVPGGDPRWLALSGEAEDLTGMKAYLVLHPTDHEDAVPIWLAQFPQQWNGARWVARPGAGPAYGGSGDILDGANPATERRLARNPKWKNMLFSERDIRSLVLLTRLLAEQNGVPRNFPLLPYLQFETGDRTNAEFIRRLILTDQQRDAIAVRLGTSTAELQANGAAFRAWHQANHANVWRRYFGRRLGGDQRPDTPCFRGILSHAINGDHPCPGPLFDWHRFAREVWDWWWAPFDTDAVSASTARRPYQQARGDTTLREYYFDASGTPADYNRLREPLRGPLGEPLGLSDRFALPLATPIYAVANGVVVAARMALSNDPASSGFLLVRHEVFHRGAGGRIDYDLEPTCVWSLTYCLDNAGFDIPAPPPAQPAAIPAANPDWLNRFVIRLRETELAVQANTPRADAHTSRLGRGWAHQPSGEGHRLTTGAEIEADAQEYRRLASDLLAGKVALFPLESPMAPTPVRVCLGDFLGLPNRMPSNQQGIQVSLFSEELLGVPGARYREVAASTEAWWAKAREHLRQEGAAEANLPATGLAWHYDLTDFLYWINADITWPSERQKHGGPVTDRPLSRTVF